MSALKPGRHRSKLMRTRAERLLMNTVRNPSLQQMMSSC